MATETKIPLSKEFNYSFEINKDAINSEKRIIEGFATTEDVDREDQVVSLKAVEKALTLYQKNPTVRADHGPPPIGSTIKAQAMQKDGHKGLFVQVQIGKNTRATDEAWTLIKQGLYRAFSIGGIVKSIKSVYSKAAGKRIQQINELLISEISITDAPANQACMFAVIGKSLVDSSRLEVGKTMSNESEFSKEVEDFSKRIGKVEKTTESLEKGQENMSKDLTEIKSILTKQTESAETEEEKKKKKEEEEDAEKAQLASLKKSLETLGLTFEEDPLRGAIQKGKEGETPNDQPETPLTISKMLAKKYGPAPKVEKGGIS